MLRILLPFAAGILVAEHFEGIPPACFALLALAGAGLWALTRAPAGALLGELVLGLGLGALALALRLHSPVPEVGSGPTALSVLRPASGRGPSCRFEAAVHGAQGGRILLQASGEACSWLPGQRALGRIQLRGLRPATNPGQRSSAKRWARRGIRRVASVQEELLLPVGGAPRGLRAWLERARRALGDVVDPPQSERRSGALLRAVVTGDRTRLSDETRRAFVESGTAHLLAISGLHVGWLFALTQWSVSTILRLVPSLSLLRRVRSLSLAAGVVAAMSYAALSGLALPALRAVAMAMAGTFAVLGGRPAAAWNVLAVAALSVLAWDPASLFEPAFALSFAAVAGILVWGGGAGRIASLVHATLGAGLATAPWLAALGAPLPRLSLLANLLAVPFFGALILPLGLASSVLGVLHPASGDVLAYVARAAAELGIQLVENFATPGLLEGSVRPARAALVLAATGFTLRLLVRRHFRAAFCASALALGSLWLVSDFGVARRAGLLFLDVGHGDAVVLRSGARAWLVDAGPRFADFDAGRSVVRPALRAEGIGALEVLLLSHADRDHIGGARTILESMPVAELWVTRAAWEASALATLRGVAARRGVPIRLVAAGDRASLGAFELSVLWPAHGFASSRRNQGSIVLRVESPQGCALLPGDIPAAVEQRLAQELYACELLKLAHHGSHSSTHPDWLDRLQPWVAIASAGRRPRSPLPHRVVRERLRARAITLYDTRRFGALRAGFGTAGLWIAPHLSQPWDATLP